MFSIRQNGIINLVYATKVEMQLATGMLSGDICYCSALQTILENYIH